jgi:hypothetical protein
MQVLEDHGLDVIQDTPGGELAGFRIFELAALLGRLRSLKVRRG